MQESIRGHKYAALLADPDAVKSGNPQGSSLYTEIASGDMPKEDAALSNDRINLVYNWIKAGAVETPSVNPTPIPSPVVTPKPSPKPSPTPLPSSPVYSDIAARVTTPSCIKCHSGSRPSAKIDLSSYAAILASPKVVIPGNPQGSSFYTEIATGSMPKRASHLSPALVTLVYECIKSGAPET